MLATLLAELALKRQFGKDSRRGKQECSVFAPLYLPRVPDDNATRIPDGRLYFIFVAGIINI